MNFYEADGPSAKVEFQDSCFEYCSVSEIANERIWLGRYGSDSMLLEVSHVKNLIKIPTYFANHRKLPINEHELEIGNKPTTFVRPQAQKV